MKASLKGFQLWFASGLTTPEYHLAPRPASMLPLCSPIASTVGCVHKQGGSWVALVVKNLPVKTRSAKNTSSILDQKIPWRRRQQPLSILA